MNAQGTAPPALHARTWPTKSPDAAAASFDMPGGATRFFNALRAASTSAAERSGAGAPRSWQHTQASCRAFACACHGAQAVSNFGICGALLPHLVARTRQKRALTIVTQTSGRHLLQRHAHALQRHATETRAVMGNAPPALRALELGASFGQLRETVSASRRSERNQHTHAASSSPE